MFSLFNLALNFLFLIFLPIHTLLVSIKVHMFQKVVYLLLFLIYVKKNLELQSYFNM